MKFKGEANYSSMKRNNRKWRGISAKWRGISAKCCHLLGKTYTGVISFLITNWCTRELL